MMSANIEVAGARIVAGGVVAYPTEYCYGLGCDPDNLAGLGRIVSLKRRSPSQGLILIAASIAQLRPYLDPTLFTTNAHLLDAARGSWPGPVTWLLPASHRVRRLLVGRHPSIAVRVSAHPGVIRLCRQAAMPIVSTSANRHGARPLRTATAVWREFGNELDAVVDGRCFGARGPSTMIDATSGAVLRAS